jgi:hypothetical protein
MAWFGMPRRVSGEKNRNQLALVVNKKSELTVSLGLLLYHVNVSTQSTWNSSMHVECDHNSFRSWILSSNNDLS